MLGFTIQAEPTLAEMMSAQYHGTQNRVPLPHYERVVVDFKILGFLVEGI